jgi:outer membrane protein assembly factor BamB
MGRTGFNKGITIVCGAVLIICGSRCCSAGDWPGWRGPTGLGYSEEKDLPLTWDAKTGKNVLWKAPLLAGRKNAPMASPGWSCPIVWRDRVFLTTAIWPDGISDKESTKSIPDHHVLCYRASDGEQLWDTRIPSGKCLVDNHYHGHAISTPVTDGKYVFVLFGSGVIAALDFDGKIIWREELPSRRPVDGGICSSLVLHGDLLILPGIANPVLRALEKKSGKLRWEQQGRQQNRMATPAILPITDSRIRNATTWRAGSRKRPEGISGRLRNPARQ